MRGLARDDDDGGPPPAPASRRSALGLRVALPFVSSPWRRSPGWRADRGVAAADVPAGDRQHAELTNATAVAAGAVWEKYDSPTTADLTPVLDLAGQAGADVQSEPAGIGGHVLARLHYRVVEPGTCAPIVVRGKRPGGRRPVHRLRAGQRR